MLNKRKDYVCCFFMRFPESGWHKIMIDCLQSMYPLI